MYGIDETVDLSFLVSASLEILGVGSTQICFNFTNGTEISCGGDYEATCPDGQIYDTANAKPHELWIANCLGAEVAEVAPSAHELTIKFENGWTLKLRDDSQQFEAFEIWHKGKLLMVV